MESIYCNMMWILMLLAPLFYITDGALYFCDSNLMEDQKRNSYLESTGYSSRSYSSGLDKCQCTIKANGTVYLKTTVDFLKDPDAEGQERNSTCGPLLKFIYKTAKHYACPEDGDKEVNETVLAYHLNHQEQLSIEVINSMNTPVQARIAFDVEVFAGTFSLQCSSVSQSTDRGVCPCNHYAMMGYGNTGFKAAEDVSSGERAAIAVVCVFIFLIIFGGIFALWWFKLRKRDDDDYPKDASDGRPPQPVPAAPSGLKHVDHGHDNPQFTDIGKHGRKINVEGDPELNLALQTPSGSMGSKGLRGSTDSGLYSQGNGHGYYANVPGEHAEGLPPDMLYTPGLNISGHADLGPGPQRTNKPVDVDALYAKPNKGGPPHHPHMNRPKAASSQDQLHPPQGPEWAVNECYVSDSSHNASQGSLNTSQPVVETDV